MAIAAERLAEWVRPEHTALVMNECQQGVVGAESSLPDLAAAAQLGMIPRLAALTEAARAAGATVIHGVAMRRPDGKGANTNARLFGFAAKSPVQLTPGTSAVEVVPEIGVDESDLVVARLHGLSPFQGTELDSLLRNLGIRTVIATGVSINVAVTNLAFDAVNAGYQVVIPRDCVASTPPEYAEAVFAHTLGVVATLVESNELIEAWKPLAKT
ncbi:MAG: cysteine hydrolase [Myxococcota bacterium]|nr:cysteine hydrolase [Myxococcota bacterium]